MRPYFLCISFYSTQLISRCLSLLTVSQLERLFKVADQSLPINIALANKMTTKCINLMHENDPEKTQLLYNSYTIIIENSHLLFSFLIFPLLMQPPALQPEKACVLSEKMQNCLLLGKCCWSPGAKKSSVLQLIWSVSINSRLWHCFDIHWLKSGRLWDFLSLFCFISHIQSFHLLFISSVLGLSCIWLWTVSSAISVWKQQRSSTSSSYSEFISEFVCFLTLFRLY